MKPEELLRHPIQSKKSTWLDCVSERQGVL